MVVYKKDGKTCEGSPLSALQAYNQIISLLFSYYFRSCSIVSLFFPYCSLLCPYFSPIVPYYFPVFPLLFPEKHEETTF